MNGTESGWDEVESLVSMSDGTIYSSQNDAVSIADSQDIDNDPGIVQDNEIITQKDYDEGHDMKQGEQQEQKPRTHNQKSTGDLNSETKIPELKDPSSVEQVKTTINGNINDKLSPINDIEPDLQTANDSDSPEKSSGEEENLEPEELLDGGAEELPFVRSVKYLEKHEIFRLFQSLAADIVYQRPDNPLQFIVDKLEKDKQESKTNSAEGTNSNEESQPS